MVMMTDTQGAYEANAWAAEARAAANALDERMAEETAAISWQAAVLDLLTRQAVAAERTAAAMEHHAETLAVWVDRG